MDIEMNVMPKSGNLRPKDETDNKALNLRVKHIEIKQKTDEEKKKARNWNMPKIEDFKCKWNVSFKYFSEKFESKLSKLDKIENEIIPQLIEFKGLSQLQISSSLCKYLDKNKEKYNIFWFEASNKINFYLQLFEMGKSENILTEMDENFVNFDEILIGKMKIDILNKLPWLFIFNNFSFTDIKEIENLIHHTRIKCVLIRDENQTFTNQEIKNSVKKVSKDDPKINEIKFYFWQKLNFKPENVSIQAVVMSENAQIVPKSFVVEILQNFCQSKCAPNAAGKITLHSCEIFTNSEQRPEEQKKDENSLEPFKIAGENYFYTDTQEIFNEILNKIFSNLNICNMIVKWVNNVLDVDCANISIGTFDKKLLEFVETLIVSFLDHDSTLESNVNKYILNILQKVDDQVNIIRKPETSVPEISSIIIPMSFIEILDDLCYSKCAPNAAGKITLHSCEIFTNTGPGQMAVEQKKIEKFIKFGEIYTDDAEILEILNKICANDDGRNMSVKWLEKLLDEDYTELDKKHLAFIDILIKVFMACESEDLKKLKILIFILRLTMIQLSIMPKTAIVVPKSFFEILQGFFILKCKIKTGDDFITHVCQNFPTCEEMLNEQNEIEKFTNLLQPAGLFSEYYYAENQKILNENLDKICSNHYICNMSIKWIESVLNIDTTIKFSITSTTSTTAIDIRHLAFVEILIKSCMAHESGIQAHFLDILKEFEEKLNKFMPNPETTVPKPFVKILEDFCKLECLEDVTLHTCQIFKTCEQMKKEQKEIEIFLKLYVYQDKIFSDSSENEEESAELYYTKNEEIFEILFSSVYTESKSVKFLETALERISTCGSESKAFVKILIKSFTLIQESNYLEDFLKILKLIDLVGKWFKYFQHKDLIGSYFEKFCDRLELSKKIQNPGTFIDEASPFIILTQVGALFLKVNPEALAKKFKILDLGKKVQNPGTFVDDTNPYIMLANVVTLFSKVNPSTGLNICENVLKKINQNSNSTQILSARIYLLRILKSKCQYKIGDVRNALKLFNDMLQYPREDYLENLKSIIRLETKIATEYLLSRDNKNTDNIEKGLSILNKNKELIEKLGKENCIEFSYPSILEIFALYQMRCGKYDEALKNLEEIEKIQNLCQDAPKNIAGTLYLITKAKFYLGIKENEERLEKSEELEKLENFEKSFETLKNILEIYFCASLKFPLYKLRFYFDNKKVREGCSSWDYCTSLTEELTKILNYYNHMKVIISPFKFDHEFKFWKSEINCYKSFENNSSEQFDQKKIEFQLDELREKSKSIELQEAEIYQWIGYCHNYQCESDRALKYYEKSQKILEKYKKFDLMLASNYYSQCQVQQILGEKNLAIEYLKKAYIQFRSCSNLEGMLMLLEKVDEILESGFTEDFRIWLVSVN